MNGSQRRHGSTLTISEPLLVLPPWSVRSLLIAEFLAIAVLSLVPTQELPQVGLDDKVQHFVAYAVLTATAALVARGRLPMIRIAIGIALFGGALEALQGLVPGRYPAFADVIANCVGVLIGWALAAVATNWGLLAVRR